LSRSSVLLVLLVASVVSAQPSPVGVSRDASAIAIVQSSLAAMGGPRLAVGQSVIMTGTLTVAGTTPVSFPITIKTHGTNQLRSELTTPKGLRVTVISGGAGAIKYPDGRLKRLAYENVAGYRNQYLPALSSLFEVSLTNMSVENLGQANVDGATADVVALGNSSRPKLESPSEATQASQMLFYIDRTTRFVSRIQCSHFSENTSNDSQGMEIRFSDYRQVQGVFVPFHQQTFADGSLLMDLQFNSVDLGAVSSDSDFALN